MNLPSAKLFIIAGIKASLPIQAPPSYFSIPSPDPFFWGTDKYLLLNIITAHYGVRLGFFNGDLESFEINFSQGPLIYFGTDSQSAIFLRIDGIMFERSAYTVFLYPLDIAGGKFSGKVGIFAEVLKVTSA